MKSALTKQEKDFIKFLFEQRLNSEIEAKEFDVVNYLKSIQGNYLEMFESTYLYHSDDRLTFQEGKIIENLYSKFYN